LFTSLRGSESDLWVIPAAGGEARNLTNAPGLEIEASWSPDGARIAFATDRDGRDLWVIPSAGGEATRLTRGNLRPGSVEWSPDGQSLVFVGDRPGGGRELYRLPATGGPARPLGAARNVGNSKLSPDGTQISYSSFEGGWAFVDVIAAAGGTPRRLTPGTDNVYHPRAIWYPDGSRLLVQQLDLPGNRDAIDLVTVRLSDATWQPLTKSLMESEVVDEFMPDGREILMLVYTTRVQVRRVQVDGVLRDR
jgi:Tol biopolymer transport system component